MKVFWKIVAAVLAVGAVVFAVVGNYERAFVCAAAGACAWLLNYRAQLRDKLKEMDQADERDVDEEDVDERVDEENL